MPCGWPIVSKRSPSRAEHGGVERATAEVVDGDDAALVDALLGGEVHGRGLRLGDEGRVGDADSVAAPCRSSSRLERSPVGRVGDDDRGRRPALALGDGVDDVAETAAISRSAEYGVWPRMIGVASPRRRLNSLASRVGSCWPRRVARVTDEQGAVVAQEHRRRDRRRVVAHADDLDAAVAGDGGRGERGAEIDAEGVRHALRNSTCSARRDEPVSAASRRGTASGDGWLRIVAMRMCTLNASTQSGKINSTYCSCAVVSNSTTAPA